MTIEDIEALKEAYFDLERSREKEVQSRLISDFVLAAITIVSSHDEHVDLNEKLFLHLKKSIGFNTAFLFQVATEDSAQGEPSIHYKIHYGVGCTFERRTGLLPTFIQRKLESKKAINVFEVNDQHDLFAMLGQDKGSVKSFILIPFKSKSSTYFAILVSNERSFYTNFHNDLASKFIPIFSQAMNQGEYLTNMLQTSKMSALGEMASGIAHEINNPLAIIALSVKNLRRMSEKGINKPELTLEVVEVIEQTIARIARIVSGMRTVSRGAQGIEISEFKLFDVFEDILGVCAERFKIGSVALEIDMDCPELDELIVCDRVQLSQVFINLISNAFDAVKNMSNAWVKIHFESQADHIMVKVIDCGKGIPAEISQKIFSPFFTTKPIGKGTGLGLSISKGIMEKLGGGLVLSPHSVNTCFVVQVPKSKMLKES